MRLEYRHLEVLVAIDDAGSLSAAAKVLNTNQPHVSRQLRRIEEHLGLPVFRRAADGVSPTSAGMQVLTRARRALSAAGDFDKDPDQPAVLRILHSRIIASSFLRQIQIEHPGIRPELAVASAEEAFPKLQGGAADVYLGMQLPHSTWPSTTGLVVQRIVGDTLMLLLPSSHPLADRPVLDLADLSGDDWITTAMPDAQEMAIGECRTVGGFEPRLRLQVHDSAHMKALLRDGFGVTFASSAWAPDEGMVLRPYAGAASSHWTVVSAPGRTPPAVVATLAELLRERFAALSRHLDTDPPVRPDSS